MSNVWISLFLAAGAAAWMYSKMGRRIGYGNDQSVWTIVAVTFVLVFAFAYTLLRFVLNLN